VKTSEIPAIIELVETLDPLNEDLPGFNRRANGRARQSGRNSRGARGRL
jgi:hypothetical protein